MRYDMNTFTSFDYNILDLVAQEDFLVKIMSKCLCEWGNIRDSWISEIYRSNRFGSLVKGDKQSIGPKKIKSH